MTTATDQAARVLVVDDEPDVCFTLAEALAADGLEVEAVTSGREALESARRNPPDLAVVDIRLGDCTGLELIGRLRGELGELPVVIVTGYGDPATLSEASRTRPVELLNKPVDVQRLRQAVRRELERLEHSRRSRHRRRRIRELTRRVHRRRREAIRSLTATCADLTATCRALQDQTDRQQALIRYQNELLGCGNEDEIFALFFRLFVHRTGPLFGVAMLTNQYAELQVVGRFGVPVPDGMDFCRDLAMATVDSVLERPEVRVIDAMDHITLFPPHLHRLLVGVTVMTVPLMIGPGELIGLAVLYRKGEQPFTEDDVRMAELVGPATAAAVRNT